MPWTTFANEFYNLAKVEKNMWKAQLIKTKKRRN